MSYTSSVARQHLNRLRKFYDVQVKQGKFKGTPIIAPSYLRAEVSLEQTTQVIAFNLLASGGSGAAANVTEQRLQVSDIFSVGAIQFNLGASTATSANPPVSTSAQLASMKLESFPNSTVFAGNSGNQATNLQAIYNGYLSITINQVAFVDRYPMYKFLYVGTSQQGTTSAAIAGPTTYTIARDEWNTENTILPVEPSFNIGGNDNVQVQINMPSSLALGFNGAGTVQTTAVLILHGFKITNATNASRNG